MLEVITRHTGPQGSGLRTIMFFNGINSTDASEAQTAVRAFWAAMAPGTSNLYSHEVEAESRLVDAIDGTVSDIVVNPTPTTLVVGASAVAPLPDVNQAMVRWQTTEVVRGKFVRGRTYFPGLTVNATTGGNLLPATQTALAGAAADLVTDTSLLVWSRPITADGTLLMPGTPCEVSSSSVWSEFAVLRRRRA